MRRTGLHCFFPAALAVGIICGANQFGEISACRNAPVCTYVFEPFCLSTAGNLRLFTLMQQLPADYSNRLQFIFP